MADDTMTIDIEKRGLFRWLAGKLEARFKSCRSEVFKKRSINQFPSSLSSSWKENVVLMRHRSVGTLDGGEKERRA